MSSRRPKHPLVPPRHRPGVMTPTALESPTLELVEVPPPAGTGGLVNAANSYLRTYRLGGCTVIVTREFGRWHMSISHKHRDPTWDEIVAARYGLIPGDVTAAMILPPLESYVNLNKRCYQVIEVRDPVLDDL